MHIQSNTLRGFTLIELLVVIAIIGILSSVVLASLNTARMKSRDSRRISDIRQLQTALALYYDANNFVYPTAAQFASSLAPTYIPALPKDPSTNANYVYSASGSGLNCTGYHLGAIIEESGASVLLNDADAAVAVPICTGGGADFAGASAACTATVAADKCYDVKP